MLDVKKLLTKVLQRLPYFYGYNVSNLNTTMHFGFGYTNSATGTPSGTGNGMVLVFPSDPNNVVIYQLYLPYSNATIYKRIYSGGSWGNWVTNS